MKYMFPQMCACVPCVQFYYFLVLVLFSRTEDKVGTVQAVKRELMGEELGEDIVNIREDEVPVGHKEVGAEAIWTGTGVCIHTVEGAANLRC